MKFGTGIFPLTFVKFEFNVKDGFFCHGGGDSMMASILGKRVNGEGKSLVFFRSLPSILIVLVLGVFLSSCRSGKVSARGTESGGGKTQLKPEEIENHAGTGFPLAGRHRELACGSCHKVPDRHREYSCHECHKGHSGDHDGRCLDCHKEGFPGGH